MMLRFGFHLVLLIGFRSNKLKKKNINENSCCEHSLSLNDNFICVRINYVVKKKIKIAKYKNISYKSYHVERQDHLTISLGLHIFPTLSLGPPL